MEELFKFLQEELTKRRLNYTIEDEVITVLLGENVIRFQIDSEEDFQSWLVFDYDPNRLWAQSEVSLYDDMDFKTGESLENFEEFVDASIDKANKYIRLKSKVDAMIQKIRETIEENDLEISANEDINFETFVSCY